MGKIVTKEEHIVHAPSFARRTKPGVVFIDGRSEAKTIKLLEVVVSQQKLQFVDHTSRVSTRANYKTLPFGQNQNQAVCLRESLHCGNPGLSKISDHSFYEKGTELDKIPY